jgi:hypothetical protein
MSPKILGRLLYSGSHDQKEKLYMKRIALGFVVAASIVIGTHPGIASAHPKTDPPCTINPNPAAVGSTYVVSASGLPSLSAINLWITAPNGTTTGTPLGSTPDGTFNLTDSSSYAGTWTYTFTGPTGHNMQTYASCSVSVY